MSQHEEKLSNGGVDSGNEGIQVVQGDIVIAHRSDDVDRDPTRQHKAVEKMVVAATKDPAWKGLELDREEDKALQVEEEEEDNEKVGDMVRGELR